MADKVKVNLGFVIDRSTAQADHLNKMLLFVETVVNGFNIGQDANHVGVVSYSTNATLNLGFHEFYEKSKVLDKIRNIAASPGQTNTGHALAFARQTLFATRENGASILVLLTTGPSGDSVSQATKELQDFGVSIFCVGLGQAFVETELTQTASQPPGQHVVTGTFDVHFLLVAEYTRFLVRPGRSKYGVTWYDSSPFYLVVNDVALITPTFKKYILLTF